MHRHTLPIPFLPLSLLRYLKPQSNPTPQSLAVSANKPHLVQYLLSKGSSPNANLRGETHTPLELACVVSADQEIVSLLLAHGSIVRGRSAAYLAAKTGRVDILETLLSPTTTTNNANASGSGNDTINLLNSLPSNDDVYDNARAQRDWGTPLHGAVGANQVAVVRWLLSRGADPAVRNYVGLTPKELADEKGFEECSKILSSSGGGEGDGL